MAKRSNDKALHKAIQIVRENSKTTTHLDEDLNKFASNFRRLYYSSNRVSFKKWCSIVNDLLDELN
jgi:inactivated superfamily I helicase